MREIKFRAYDKHTKIMLPVVDIIKFTKSEDISITRDGAYGVGINMQYQPHIELMQYTGLKDKNGKEIYENMIINKKYIVVYEFGKFILKDIQNGDITDFERNGVYEITGEYLE